MYSNQQKGGLQTPALGLNLNAGSVPFPTYQPEAILALPLVQQACLVLMAFVSNALTYSDPPKPPRFPSLSMILYWGFYNHLCLLHPCHYQGQYPEFSQPAGPLEVTAFTDDCDILYP